MRQAGKGIGQRKPSQITVDPVEHSGLQPAMNMPGLEEGAGFDWLRALGIIRKHWKLSAIFAGIVLVTVTAFTIFSTPIYQATARIEVDPSGEKFSLNGASGATDAEYLETQAQVLQGDTLEIGIVRKLRLDQNPTLGKFYRETSNAAKVKSADSQQLTLEENVALGNLKAGFKVKRDTASRLILVSFTGSNPQLAAQIANTAVQSFIEQSFQSRHDAVMKSTEWLSRQLDDIRQKMDDSTQALTQFQQSVGVTDIDSNRSTFTEHMGELSRQQTMA